jgi:6-phosphogluconolactonase
MSMVSDNQIVRSPDALQAAQACAAHILDRLEAALAARPRATLAISGGNSPRPMFEIFAKSKFEWQRVDLFWVDERHVPRTDPQSNFKLAKDTWLAPAAFPAMNIHAVDTGVPPEESALRYAAEIHRCFTGPRGTPAAGDPAGVAQIPTFDVIHLGMGPDCHTASLFPGEPMIDDRTHLTAGLWVEKMKQWRVTLLPGVLIAARDVAMLITGSDKAEPLEAALHGTHDPRNYPSQLVTRDRGGAMLFIDEPAAGLLSRDLLQK